MNHRAKVRRQCWAEAIECKAKAVFDRWAEAMLQCWAELFFGAAEDPFGGGSERLENQAIRTKSSYWLIGGKATKDESGHALWHDQRVVTEGANRNERWVELRHTRWYDQ